jgi:hypothetical protein
VLSWEMMIRNGGKNCFKAFLTLSIFFIRKSLFDHSVA